MKKLILSLLMVTALVACTSQETETTLVDSTLMDSTCADSTCCDSTKVSVDSVKVENLTQCTSLNLSGSDILQLIVSSDVPGRDNG